MNVVCVLTALPTSHALSLFSGLSTPRHNNIEIGSTNNLAVASKCSSEVKSQTSLTLFYYFLKYLNPFMKQGLHAQGRAFWAEAETNPPCSRKERASCWWGALSSSPGFMWPWTSGPGSPLLHLTPADKVTPFAPCRLPPGEKARTHFPGMTAQPVGLMSSATILFSSQLHGLHASWSQN